MNLQDLKVALEAEFPWKWSGGDRFNRSLEAFDTSDKKCAVRWSCTPEIGCPGDWSVDRGDVGTWIAVEEIGITTPEQIFDIIRRLDAAALVFRNIYYAGREAP